MERNNFKLVLLEYNGSLEVCSECENDSWRDFETKPDTTFVCANCGQELVVGKRENFDIKEI